MKRFIITSACTLVLSLLGAFGSNQNIINLDKILNTNSNTTSVEEVVTNKEIDQSLPSDNQITVADNAAQVTETDVNEVAPQETNNLVLNDINVEEGLANTENEKTSTTATIDADAGQSDKAPTTQEVAVKSAQVNDAKPAATANVRAQEVVNSSKNGQQYGKTHNKQAFVYKNVDLSNCDSVNEVVSELQKNGFTNINKNNIQNIKSLQEVLALIKGSGYSTPTTKPSPTTAPAPTTQPAPTAVPTTKPEPTTKPAPTTAPAPTTEPSGNTGVSSYANEVLRLVNIERAKAGLGAFTTNQTISGAANKRAQEIVQSFSHTRPNGSSFSTALQEYGVSYRAAGENIAWGQRSPQEVVTGWMNSPGHRANILSANFNKIGIGVYQTGGVIYWTQLFTN